jgi:tetratricopeptide (TPR) repeat protein
MARVDLSMGAFALTDDRAARYSAAETNSIKAVSLAPDHAWAHVVLGSAQVFTNRAAQGIAECEQALALDRNLAFAHNIIGIGKFYMGRAAETEGHIREAFRLSPRDIFGYRWMQTVGWSKIQLGADAEAVRWLRRSIEANRNHPLTHFYLAGALALLGSLDEARTAAQAGLALNPNFTIRLWRDTKSTDNPAYLAARERLFEGLRLAGVPEG